MAESLSSSLFNERRFKVLKLLVDNPGSSFSISDLVESSGVSKPIVIDFVDKLDRLGIVDKKKHGNAYLVSLNRGSDYVSHLEKILELDTQPLLESVDCLKQDLVEELGDDIVAIVLYGSVARGSPDVDSDIDLLVVTWKETKSVENRIEGITKEFQQLKGLKFSPLVMPVEEVKERVEAEDGFIKTIYDEGKVLYGGEKWSEIPQKTP